MSAYVIWMDMDHAKIFSIAESGRSMVVVERSEIRHHTNADPENHKNTHRYFLDVASRVRDASEIVLMGPSLAKDHFNKFLAEKFEATVSKKVVGILTTDHPTENQLLEQARKFFKVHDAFEAPVA